MHVSERSMERRRLFYDGRRRELSGLGGSRYPVGQGIFDQIGGAVQIEPRQNLALMKLNRP